MPDCWRKDNIGRILSKSQYRTLWEKKQSLSWQKNRNLLIKNILMIIDYQLKIIFI